MIKYGVHKKNIIVAIIMLLVFAMSFCVVKFIADKETMIQEQITVGAKDYSQKLISDDMVHAYYNGYAEYYGGTDAVPIKSAEQFQAFMESKGSMHYYEVGRDCDYRDNSGHYIVENDIDMSGIEVYPRGTN